MERDGRCRAETRWMDKSGGVVLTFSSACPSCSLTYCCVLARFFVMFRLLNVLLRHRWNQLLGRRSNIHLSNGEAGGRGAHVRFAPKA
jgi:hypothetical protein